MATVKPTRTSTVRETVVLESKTAKVYPFPPAKCQSREWLMRDVCSTAYATVIRS